MESRVLHLVAMRVKVLTKLSATMQYMLIILVIKFKVAVLFLPLLLEI